jgi:hypothetical protein
MGNIGVPELLLLLLFFIFVVLPFWRIFGKAGFPPALALLMVVPLVNIVMLFVLAFASWPTLARTPK